MMVKLACFLKVKQKLTGRGCQNHVTEQSAFCEKEKIAREKFLRFKRKISFNFLSFEGKRIDFGISKPKLRRFEIRHFCDKMRPFCTISSDTFWKIHPDVCMYVCMKTTDEM